MTLFPRLDTHWPFRYPLLVLKDVYRYDQVWLFPPKYQGLDGSLNSSFELSDNSSGGYFKNFMTGMCGPNLEDTPYSCKAQA